MTSTNPKPEPLTEAQLAEFHDRGIGGGGLSAFWANKLLATLDATRAALAKAEAERAEFLAKKRDVSAKLTAATERVAELEREAESQADRIAQLERKSQLTDMERIKLRLLGEAQHDLSAAQERIAELEDTIRVREADDDIARSYGRNTEAVRVATEIYKRRGDDWRGATLPILCSPAPAPSGEWRAEEGDAVMYPWERLENIVRYIASHGWALASTLGNFDVWQRVNETGVYVHVPKHEEWGDYRHRAHDVLRELAEVEERDIIAVAIDVGGYVPTPPPPHPEDGQRAEEPAWHGGSLAAMAADMVCNPPTPTPQPAPTPAVDVEAHKAALLAILQRHYDGFNVEVSEQDEACLAELSAFVSARLRAAPPAEEDDESVRCEACGSRVPIASAKYDGEDGVYICGPCSDHLASDVR